MTMISRESFESANEETKLLLIYDMLTEHNVLLVTHMEEQAKTCAATAGKCDIRLGKLERTKFFHAGLAASGGLIGGVIAVATKTIFMGK